MERWHFPAHYAAMPDDFKAYRVFIASPGGLTEERQAVRDLINEFNESSAHHEGAVFLPIGWEITLPGRGRPQEKINEDLRRCDYCLLVMHDRWGSPTSSEESPQYKSGTHEEFCVAVECCDDDSMPMRDVVIAFKQVMPDKLSDPGPQLQEVLAFKRRLEEDRDHLYDVYDDLDLFKKNFRRQLDAWLRDHRNGGGGSAVCRGPSSPMPIEPEGMKRPIEGAAHSAVGNPALSEAERLAKEGKLVDAETKFAEATLGMSDVNALNQYGKFLMFTGRLAAAEVMYSRVLQLAIATDRRQWRAVALGNLGLVHQTRGELDQAEELHLQALEIDKQIGRVSELGSHYGNLGLIYKYRGDLNRAESMYRESIRIDEELGRREALSNQYCNLGAIYATRGQFDSAEDLFRKALIIDEELERLDGVATVLGNLGTVYCTRGETAEAEQYFVRALAINESLGRTQGVSTQYNNLAQVCIARKDYAKAESLLKSSLALESDLGRPEGIASAYGNLGIIYQAQGDLNLAEDHYRKALAIEEGIGRREGVAISYGALGALAGKRGNYDQAEEFLRQSLEIYEEIGELKGVAGANVKLGLLSKERGNQATALYHWKHALAIYESLGLQHLIDDLKESIEQLVHEE